MESGNRYLLSQGFHDCLTPSPQCHSLNTMEAQAESDQISICCSDHALSDRDHLSIPVSAIADSFHSTLTVSVHQPGF